MTDLPAELVSAVLADIEDDGPRLACADWLDEAGRPDDARFVRLQCRLARREALRLSSREVSRLNAEQSELLAANRERWLEPLGASGFDGTWERGFLVRLSLLGSADARGVLARLGAYPLLERVTIDARLFAVPPAEIGELPPLLRLAELSLVIAGRNVPEAGLLALGDQPRLTMPQIFRRDGEDDLWAVLTLEQHHRIAQLRRDSLRRIPADRLPGILTRDASEIRRARNGLLRVQLRGPSPLGDPDALARLTGVASVSLDASADHVLPPWLAAHRDLRGLNVHGLWHVDRAGFARLPMLAFVCLSGLSLEPREWDTLAGCLLGLPRLRTLWLGGGSNPPPETVLARLAEHPALFELSLLVPREGRTPLLPAERGPAWADTVGGVSLTLPGGFASVPDAPRSDDVETLGTWCEWGDGDPADRVPLCGPLWLTLERLPGRHRVADAGRLLTSPLGELAAARSWSGVQTAPGFRWAAGTCPFARHLRALWLGKASALRLRCEWPTLRHPDGEVVARRIADSVRVG